MQISRMSKTQVEFYKNPAATQNWLFLFINTFSEVCLTPPEIKLKVNALTDKLSFSQLSYFHLTVNVSSIVCLMSQTLRFFLQHPMLLCGYLDVHTVAHTHTQSNAQPNPRLTSSRGNKESSKALHLYPSWGMVFKNNDSLNTITGCFPC